MPSQLSAFRRFFYAPTQMNVAAYMEKVYPDPPCWALVADIFINVRGVPVDEYSEITNSIRQVAADLRARAAAAAFRLVLRKNAHGFAQIAEPIDYALVLLGQTPTLGLHHAGIYYQGKVLHALSTGTLYQDLASLRDQYQLMEFWAR